jgi:hypothetical protein
MNNIKIENMKNWIKKTLATALMIMHILDFSVFRTYALTGGPSQPEVQSFTPVGTSDLVNLFTGDFTYNIPLLEVEGYPINIAYQAGVSMDQEASWVGLGWNINPGVANRNLRGLPDDFAGDTITKEMNMKPNNTYGVQAGVSGEIFGLDKDKIKIGVGLGYSVGINWNNYAGIGMEKGLSASYSLSFGGADKAKNKFTAGLGLNSSSSNGLSITPELSYSSVIAKNQQSEDKLTSSSSISSTFNSRAGLRQLTIQTGITASTQGVDKAKREGEKDKSYSSSMELVSASAVFNFGTATYMPSVDLPLKTYSGTGRFTAGGEIFGFHGNAHIQGYFSSQSLAVNKIQNPAYGYLNSTTGQKRNEAILDFNREKDGAYLRTEHANLALTNFTFDTYGITAQGISMSYRPMRNDVGFVFDAASYSTSSGGSIGIEVGGGNIWHGGGDVKIDVVNSKSGAWRSGNEVASHLEFKATGERDDYESVYFKEAGERSVSQNPNWISSYGGYEPVYIGIDKRSKFNAVAVPKLYKEITSTPSTLPSKNSKEKRDLRNQVLSYLKNNELDKYGLIGEVNTGHKPHHIGEISVLQPTGERYIFSIPAYNTYQREVTFSTGKKLNNLLVTTSGGEGLQADCATGLVNYNHNNESGDNSIKNNRGIDHYFNAVTTPEYSHSHLLTAVVSSDYSDIDGIRGPSDNDLGAYTRFVYQKIEDYKWRIPFTKANANEGLSSDVQDDKANYLYGEKELWYLDTVITKNYIAIFHKSSRKDGYGANENGTIDLSKAQLKLDSISLYSKPDFRANQANAIPLKRVHFEYSYELCSNVPNNSGVAENFDLDRNGSAENINANKGKLTLKRIYFTHQNVQRTRYNPYEFTYSSFNPAYDIKSYDRWGNYKPNNTNCDLLAEANNSENPYTPQDKASVDQWVQSWTLTQIKLPSGGTINIEYESDDYAYVQHKKAMQMFEVVSATIDVNWTSQTIPTSPWRIPLSNGTEKNFYLIFKMQPGFSNANDYFDGIDQLYFKFLMNFQKTEDPMLPGWVITSDTLYDYVQGYAQILEKGAMPHHPGYGYVKLKPVDLGDGATGNYNPISKAAIQFGRMHLSKIMYDQDVTDLGFGRQMLQAMKNSSFALNLSETVQGPNKAKWNEGRGRKFISKKSWIRLVNPSSKKLGGGLRVKKITMTDAWSDMTSGQERTMTYGQEYSYELPDGTSSGVAAYEPILGGEENPFRLPVFYKQGRALAPDDRFYKEEPFGESFFPAPTVGYSSVTVKNIGRNNVEKNATGKTIDEFYTYKDFPVITKRTDVLEVPGKSTPYGLSALFKVNVRDYLTTSQGYYVELNDMHGKPKAKKVFQEGKYDEPISSVEYRYKQESGSYPNTFRLNNKTQVIDGKGDVSSQELGVVFDVVADMREHKTEMESAGAQLNIDGFYIPPFITLAIPIVLPSYSSEKTQFRSAVTTKVVQRFGLMEETIASDLGSTVTTQNVAYDAQTGDVLLTKVINDFNDSIYNLKFPANWYYETMGQASKNIMLEKTNVEFNNGEASIYNANLYFSEGDILALSTGDKAWIKSVNPSSIFAIDQFGNNIHGNLDLKIIQSGRKNLISAPMAQLTSLSNPLTSIKTNLYEQVLAATAIEYDDQWRTYCDCIDDQFISNHANPYLIGFKGNWKPKKNQTYLAERVHSSYNKNSNIRKDGVFKSYSPFYRMQADKTWNKDTRNWTYTSEVTEFNALGQGLEEKDALGRYSASSFGYNGSIPTMVGVNSRHRDMGFDGFEDYAYNTCIDGHFKFLSASSNITEVTAHSGRKSMKVVSGAPVILSKDIEDCALEGCKLSLQTSASGGSPYNIQVNASDGQGPYSFEYQIYSGSPQIGPVDEDSFGINGTTFKVKFIVYDANGCSTIQIVEQ